MTDKPDDNPKEGDPFEELDEAVGEREGDPFENLSEDEDAQSTESLADSDSDDFGSAGQADQTEASSKPTERPASNKAVETPADDQEQSDAIHPSGENNTPKEAATTDDEFQPEDPSGMSFGIGRDESESSGPSFTDVGDREGDPFENVKNAFEEVDVEQVDPDAVWQELTSAESRGSVGDAQQRTYAEVSKHSYCEQCEHFSSPPEIYCKHEGTEIVEFTDMKTVRVVDCPVVTERKKLEEGN